MKKIIKKHPFVIIKDIFYFIVGLIIGLYIIISIARHPIAFLKSYFYGFPSSNTTYTGEDSFSPY